MCSVIQELHSPLQILKDKNLSLKYKWPPHPDPKAKTEYILNKKGTKCFLYQVSPKLK